MNYSEASEELQLFTLKNSRGTELKILNFGATIFSLTFQKGQKKINVVVGPEKPEDYLGKTYRKRGKYFGSSVGRYAGRISGGGFEIGGQRYELFTKDCVHLHGGKCGFTYKFWKVEEIVEGDNPSVLLSYFSKDGEEGYPGNLQVYAKYTLTAEDEVKIEYTAETDEKTVINLTNHTYFNLQGEGDVRNHQLQIGADKILETDEKLFPTGQFLEVKGSDKDFRKMKVVDDIFLDTVFVFSEANEEEKNIILESPKSGISLKVFSRQPGVVVYVPEELPQDWQYSTKIADHRQAICLETQNFPDAPNHPAFPSAQLSPGEKYRNKTLWKFDF